MENKSRKKEDPGKVLARQIKFQKAHIVQLSVKLNDNTDADIIKYLDTLDNKRAYILGLIRADMAKKKAGE